MPLSTLTLEVHRETPTLKACGLTEPTTAAAKAALEATAEKVHLLWQARKRAEGFHGPADCGRDNDGRLRCAGVLHHEGMSDYKGLPEGEKSKRRWLAALAKAL